MAEYGNFLHDEIADWEDLEDIDIRGRTRMFKNRRDPFESYLDHEFIQRFRLSKTVALDLLARIQHLLPDSATGRGKSCYYFGCMPICYYNKAILI